MKGMTDMKIAMTASGKVQGVGFRYTIQLLATQMNITGIVKNQSSGDVYIEACGSEENVQAFIEKVRNSPSRFCCVDHLYLDTSKKIGDYANFSIIY